MHRSPFLLLLAALTASLGSGSATLAQTPCVNGLAGGYPCNNVDLLAHMTLAQLGASGAQPNAADLWGWTDPLTGREYAIIGLNNGTAFVDVTVPTAPVRIGNLPSHFATSNLWRDVDVAGDWCYIGSELAGHGLQVFDLTRLRNVPNPPVTFTEDAWTGVIGNSHTLYADKQHPYVYTVGTTSINNGGLTVLDVTNPLAPVLVGTHTIDGYIHENVVYTYGGPDPDHQGKQLSFNFHSGTPDKITIVDVTDKTDMNTLATITYSGARISHQGWLTEDQRYLLMNDEGDETQFGHGTRTRIFDLVNIDAPVFLGAYTAPIASVDHNLYVHRGAVYESNYTSGLRILDTAGVSAGTLTPVAHFDTYLPNDGASYNGAWGNYPYFGSGIVAVSGLGEGLFLLRPQVGVRLKAFLEGPYVAQDGTMRDDLRAQGLLPLTEPYTGLGYVHTGGGGGETVQASVLSITGPDAIVDWVVVELRAPADPTAVVASRSALIQRDGDVVAVDGTGPVRFNVAPGPWHVAVRHRNHLGVMTAQPVHMAIGARTVDLRIGTPLYGTAAAKDVAGVSVLWAGNALRDDRLRYTGGANDRDPILVAIGGVVPTATTSGYLGTDINLDGVVKYAGGANDRDPILVNIGGAVPTATRQEQLP
ncbi:MAG: choice-of-anchor B family protein [Flavobacteriales bacterium]|nr:choice-of-anchor B family protein [Flavobacteriales bacterium]